MALILDLDLDHDDTPPRLPEQRSVLEQTCDAITDDGRMTPLYLVGGAAIAGLAVVLGMLWAGWL